MANVVIELTNHCNLKCRHCSEERHRADKNLSISVLEKVVSAAKSLGFDHLSFTGGEPTIHPEFATIVEMVHRAGYTFSFVSNGWNFTAIYEKIVPFLDRLSCITFSLDGATGDTHDRVRAEGSYMRLMHAISICMIKDIPFTFNTLVTTNNRHEIEEIAVLAEKLGSRGLRFGHLMPTPGTIREKLDMSPEEKKGVDASVLRIDKTCKISVFMAPGHFTKDIFPCAPLKMQEMNIDCMGQVTMCCHLSGYKNGIEEKDVICSLHDEDFSWAYRQFTAYNRQFHQDKVNYFTGEHVMDLDYFPCWYCLNYFKKVDWLLNFPDNSWYQGLWRNRTERRELINE